MTISIEINDHNRCVSPMCNLIVHWCSLERQVTVSCTKCWLIKLYYPDDTNAVWWSHCRVLCWSSMGTSLLSHMHLQGAPSGQVLLSPDANAMQLTVTIQTNTKNIWKGKENSFGSDKFVLKEEKLHNIMLKVTQIN